MFLNAKPHNDCLMQPKQVDRFLDYYNKVCGVDGLTDCYVKLHE